MNPVIRCKEKQLSHNLLHDDPASVGSFYFFIPIYRGGRLCVKPSLWILSFEGLSEPPEGRGRAATWNAYPKKTRSKGRV
jgi:hypothetical protein